MKIHQKSHKGTRFTLSTSEVFKDEIFTISNFKDGAYHIIYPDSINNITILEEDVIDNFKSGYYKIYNENLA